MLRRVALLLDCFAAGFCIACAIVLMARLLWASEKMDPVNIACLSALSFTGAWLAGRLVAQDQQQRNGSADQRRRDIEEPGEEKGPRIHRS